MPILETAKVIGRAEINSGLFVFRLESPQIAGLAKPGQFLEIDPGRRFFLRRPFSIQDADSGILEILIKVVGEGTAELVENTGKWNIFGPLGRGFDTEAEGDAVLVGGGVGVAPLKMLYREFQRRNRDSTFLIGARTEAEIPMASDDPVRSELVIATDDGSAGFQGTVVELLQDALPSRLNPYIYACGPLPMLKALKEYMREKELPGEFSLENRMACGMGVCQGCGIPSGDAYKMVCKDGPVLNVEEIGEEYL